MAFSSGLGSELIYLALDMFATGRADHLVGRKLATIKCLLMSRPEYLLRGFSDVRLGKICNSPEHGGKSGVLGRRLGDRSRSRRRSKHRRGTEPIGAGALGALIHRMASSSDSLRIALTISTAEPQIVSRQLRLKG